MNMNFATLSRLAAASLALFASSSSALSLLGFCTRPGFVRFSHRHRFGLHLPHFRGFVKTAEDGDAVHDAENVFHLLKGLPNDCFTYVS